MPPSDRMATSVVPPPMSTTIEPVGSVTGRPAPIAAAIGSSISHTLRAPALSADSWMGGVRRRWSRTARRPRSGMGEGAAIVHLGDEVLDHRFGDFEVGDDAVAQRRIAWMLPGVRPSIILASSPTASTWRLPLCVVSATTDGSFGRCRDP